MKAIAVSIWPTCAHCGLPTTLHFAWCQESRIRGNMPPDALRPGAIVRDPRELRIRPLSFWLAKHNKPPFQPKI